MLIYSIFLSQQTNNEEMLCSNDLLFIYQTPQKTPLHPFYFSK